MEHCISFVKKCQKRSSFHGIKQAALVMETTPQHLEFSGASEYTLINSFSCVVFAREGVASRLLHCNVHNFGSIPVLK